MVETTQDRKHICRLSINMLCVVNENKYLCRSLILKVFMKVFLLRVFENRISAAIVTPARQHNQDWRNTLVNKWIYFLFVHLIHLMLSTMLFIVDQFIARDIHGSGTYHANQKLEQKKI